NPLLWTLNYLQNTQKEPQLTVRTLNCLQEKVQLWYIGSL
ncbi:hypothetical protein QZH41_017554, partial [Actinostola sp. cb2023]